MGGVLLQSYRYGVHKFIGRKPHDLVGAIIECYSKKGDIVLDPFVGSGTTACEALILGRGAMASDIDPLSLFITRMLCLAPTDMEALETGYQEVSGQTKERILAMYRLDEMCGRCGSRLVSHWLERRTGLVKTICPLCMDWRRSMVRRISADEQTSLARLEQDLDRSLPIDGWTSSRFTTRATTALSTVLTAIGKVKGGTRDDLKYAFSANLVKSSLLNCRKSSGKGWILDDPYRLQIPPSPLEFNVWMGFENRYRSLVLARQETNRLIAPRLDDMSGLKIMEHSATNLAAVKDGSVDLCVTDPPYSDRISYSMLHRINRTWLGLTPTCLEGEIMPGSQPWQQERYIQDMASVLDEIGRVLRSRGPLLIVMEGSEARLRAAGLILRACRMNKLLRLMSFDMIPHHLGPHMLIRLQRRR